MELLKKANGNIVRTAEEKAHMIEQAAEYYGKFLYEVKIINGEMIYVLKSKK